MIKRKVKAGALQMTLFIVVVIALLLASFLIYVHTYTQFKTQSNFVIETAQSANKGVDYALHNRIPLNDSINIDLKNEDYKSLKVTRGYWGLFEKVSSEAKIKNYMFTKQAIIGATQPMLNRTALNLEENNKPLVVVGNTKIQGVSYLPEIGVKSGNISGHSYYGEQLIYGSIRQSGHLPKVFSELKEHLKNISMGDQTNFIDISKAQEFKNSFFEPLQIVYSPDEIRLETISLTGHIVVQSKTNIVVEVSSHLKDVILIAPKVEIKDNVFGTFQVIATESITVGENCELHYPSALVVYSEDALVVEEKQLSEPENNGITIKPRTTINGIVFWDAVTKANNFEPQILIDENVFINGEVYCNSNIELKGTVHGTIYTSNFVAKQSGSIYQNHIYNGSIIVDELPQEYVGLTFETSKKGVIKWLY